ncbi:MAG: phosphatidate cytidylyltransferase, partial [Acidobacteriales bacterium]|nr:phosphatidate cytidylyltransferase [Terriglobales bacterium]
MAAKSGLEIFRVSGHGISLLLLASFYRSPADAWLALFLLAASGLLFLALGLGRGKRLSSVLPGAAATVLGLLYVPMTLGFLVVVQRTATPWGAGKQWIFFLLLVVWFGDTGAYYAGRAFGRHALAPLISPKKTIEGAVGGLAGNALAAFLGKQIFLPEAPLVHLL